MSRTWVVSLQAVVRREPQMDTDEHDSEGRSRLAALLGHCPARSVAPFEWFYLCSSVFHHMESQSAILNISASAASISCSREFFSRRSKPASMASFLFWRAQITNGKPNRSRYSRLYLSNRAALFGAELVQAAARLLASGRRRQGPCARGPPGQVGVRPDQTPASRLRLTPAPFRTGRDARPRGSRRAASPRSARRPRASAQTPGPITRRKSAWLSVFNPASCIAAKGARPTGLPDLWCSNAWFGLR